MVPLILTEKHERIFLCYREWMFKVSSAGKNLNWKNDEKFACTIYGLREDTKDGCSN